MLICSWANLLSEFEIQFCRYKILIFFSKFQHHMQWFRMGSMCNWNFVFCCNFPLQASFHPGNNSEYKKWFLDNNVKIQICICPYYCQLICFNIFSNFQFWWQPRKHFSKCFPAISCSNSIHFSYEIYFMPKFKLQIVFECLSSPTSPSITVAITSKFRSNFCKIETCIVQKWVK